MPLDVNEPWTAPAGFDYSSRLWNTISNDPLADDLEANGYTTTELRIRHTGVLIVGDQLQVFYSKRGVDEPERIQMSTIDLTVGHNNWDSTYPGEEIIQAELDWEGGN